MTTSEQDRHALHGKLEEVLGHDHAATLMAQLPPMSWADLVSKHDLAGLGERVETRIEGVETRLQGVETRLQGIDTRLQGVEARMEDTRRDLDLVGERVELRIETFEHRVLATLHRELNLQMRTTVLALAATASVVIAAVRL